MLQTNPRARASPIGQTLRALTGQADASAIRKETWRGTEYTVVPVVALVEGVHQCATCPTPELYLASEFADYPQMWNGRPVTIQHPQIAGAYVSANTRSVLDDYQVGTLFNSRLQGGKLKAELWIDPARVNELGAEAQAALEALEAGDPVEVSTGYWADTEPSSGTRDGRPYDGVQRNVKPDHIALLPGGTGACSWADGCGAPRTNQKGAARVTAKPKGLLQRLKDLFTPNAEGMSDVGARDALETALADLTGEPMAFMIREVYPQDHTVVYQTNAGPNDYGWNGPLYEASYTENADGTITATDPRQVMRKVTYESVPAANSGAATDEPPAPPEAAEPVPNDCGCEDEPNVLTVPRNVSTQLAPRNAPWSRPRLSDWTDKNWSALTAAERRRIAGHFAYAPSADPSTYTFGALKYPHHRPSDGHVVWDGLVAAAQRINQSNIPDSELPAVKRHLAAHYRAFGETAPWAGRNNMDKVNALISNSATRFEEADREWLEGLSDEQLDKLAPNETVVEAPPDDPPAAEEPPIDNAAPLTVDEALTNLEKTVGPEIAGTIRAAHKRALEHRAELVRSITSNAAAGFTEDDLKALTDEHLEKLARATKPVDYSGQAPRGNRKAAPDNDPPEPTPIVLAKPAPEGSN